LLRDRVPVRRDHPRQRLRALRALARRRDLHEGDAARAARAAHSGAGPGAIRPRRAGGRRRRRAGHVPRLLAQPHGGAAPVTAAIFYLAGAVALGSAIAVILQRNPFLAALGLILHLASLAVLYLVLQADFVAAAQVLVYAGAVMIMFLFVIAYLGDRAEIG